MNSRAMMVAALVSAWAFGSQAAELVVIEAKGVELKPGQVVAGDRPLALAAGQRVSLVAPNGRILRLEGPADGPPEAGPAPDDRSVLGALKEMVHTRQASTSALGVTRTGTTNLPAPWLVDVSASGAACVVEGTPVVLWRPDAKGALPLVVASGAVKARAVWPDGAQRLMGPDDLRPADGAVMTVTVGERSTQMVLNVLPAALGTDEMRLAWLVERDCLPQAAALARELD